LTTAQGRVALWRRKWPEITARSAKDSAGQVPKDTFFFVQEKYCPKFLEPLAEMTRSGIADVEVHIHHDGDGRDEFTRKMTTFCQVLHKQHGLLRRRQDGKLAFGFIHGNWALDNSLSSLANVLGDRLFPPDSVLHQAQEFKRMRYLLRRRGGHAR
jgi:hypothetical protein